MYQKRRRRRLGEVVVRTTVTVPKTLKEQMDASGQSVNWSEVACQAFARHLQQSQGSEEQELDYLHSTVALLCNRAAAMQKEIDDLTQRIETLSRRGNATTRRPVAIPPISEKFSERPPDK